MGFLCIFGGFNCSSAPERGSWQSSLRQLLMDRSKRKRNFSFQKRKWKGRKIHLLERVELIFCLLFESSGNQLWHSLRFGPVTTGWYGVLLVFEGCFLSPLEIIWAVFDLFSLGIHICKKNPCFCLHRWNVQMETGMRRTQSNSAARTNNFSHVTYKNFTQYKSPCWAQLSHLSPPRVSAAPKLTAQHSPLVPFPHHTRTGVAQLNCTVYSHSINVSRSENITEKWVLSAQFYFRFFCLISVHKFPLRL